MAVLQTYEIACNWQNYITQKYIYSIRQHLSWMLQNKINQPAKGLAWIVTSLIRTSLRGRKVFSLTGTFSNSSRFSNPSIILWMSKNKQKCNMLYQIIYNLIVLLCQTELWALTNLLSKNSVFHVQMRLFCVSDEELWCICVRSVICHGNNASDIVLQITSIKRVIYLMCVLKTNWWIHSLISQWILGILLEHLRWHIILYKDNVTATNKIHTFRCSLNSSSNCRPQILVPPFPVPGTKNILK